MPSTVLYVLAVIATLFAASSFTGYGLAGDRSARWLRVTMVANVVYCVLTSALVAIHLRELRPRNHGDLSGLPGVNPDDYEEAKVKV